jgi:hypothetical protein
MTPIWMWFCSEWRNRWKALLGLMVLIAFATAGVSTAVAGARRGATTVDRLLADTLPATLAVLPNMGAFDWDVVRDMSDVEAVTAFVVSPFGVEGLGEEGSQVSGFPPVDDDVWQSAQGSAGPGNGASFTEVKLTKPAKKTVKLPSDIYFPIQHSLALMEAAKAGRNMFTANLYDGSDKGEKFYETNAVIGRRSEPGTVELPAKVASAGKLKTLASWPIAISYFEPGPSRTDAVPTYELAFRFYENGVSTKLYIDYGDFAIRGELKELTFLAEGKCPPDKR